MSRVTDKQVLIDWEEFRRSTRIATPVDRSESPADKKKRIDRLEDDPQAWKAYYFPQYFKYPSPDFHITASERLHKMLNKNKHWYEVRHWARGLAKTTTAMFDVLFFVLTGKLKNIVYTSSTYDSAERFLTNYQVQLDSNQRIINDYGPQELTGSWEAGNFATRRGAKFMALGAGQSPRGASNQQFRIDCILVDDFDTDEECRNEEIIDKKWSWFEQALFFTVDPAEPYLILFLGNIIAENCCVVRASRVADHSETINIRDASNKSVWPEKNKEEDIDYQIAKVSYESSQKEMFNNPMTQGKTFKEITWGTPPPLKSLLYVVSYADPATSNKDKPTLKSRAQNSCKAVILVGVLNDSYYVYKVFCDNTTNANFVDWMFEIKRWVKQASVLYTYIENNSLQDPFYDQIILPMIFRRSKELKEDLYVTPDTDRKSEKWFRIEATLEPLNRVGRLVFNVKEKDDPHMKRLTAQLLSASANSRTLDGPDALQGAVKKIQDKNTVADSDGIQVVRKLKKNRY